MAGDWPKRPPEAGTTPKAVGGLDDAFRENRGAEEAAGAVLFPAKLKLKAELAGDGAGVLLSPAVVAAAVGPADVTGAGGARVLMDAGTAA